MCHFLPDLCQPFQCALASRDREYPIVNLPGMKHVSSQFSFKRFGCVGACLHNFPRFARVQRGCAVYASPGWSESGPSDKGTSTSISNSARLLLDSHHNSNKFRAHQIFMGETWQAISCLSPNTLWTCRHQPFTSKYYKRKM